MDSEMIMIVSIVAIACATGLIKNWMKYRFKESVDKERFERLAQAFVQHKKEMQQRISEIESFLADKKSKIEEEEEDYRQIEVPEDEGRLTNDLKQKEKVRS